MQCLFLAFMTVVKLQAHNYEYDEGKGAHSAIYALRTLAERALEVQKEL